MNKLDMVKEWRRTFGLPVSETPVVPSEDQLRLHKLMIQVEANEIYDAQTHIDIRDVIADLHYFVLGLASEAGVTQEQLDSDFDKVHAANMAKLWTEEQVREKFNPLRNWMNINPGVALVSHEENWPEGIWTVKQDEETGMFKVFLNGKVQKPPGWVPAVLEGGAV